MASEHFLVLDSDGNILNPDAHTQSWEAVILRLISGEWDDQQDQIIQLGREFEFGGRWWPVTRGAAEEVLDRIWKSHGYMLYASDIRRPLLDWLGAHTETHRYVVEAA